MLGKYLARTQGAAKVAVIFQNDDYGKDLLNGLKKGIQRSKVKVVAAEPYEVTAAGRAGAGREAEGVGRQHVRRSSRRRSSRSSPTSTPRGSTGSRS